MISTPAEISYAHSATNAVSRGLIRSIENVTGRPRLIRMALNYERDVKGGRDFWEVMQERYSISFAMPDNALENLPASGPAVCIANHPFGILDGLAMGRLISMRRKDFKIIANSVFQKAEELNEHILPISFDNTREARALNIETRREALRFLAEGGAIAIFPGGCVSTAAKPFGAPIDPKWKTFTAKMISKSDAAVVPMFFEGTNSRFFQVISHISQTLRLAFLIKEFGNRVGKPLGIHIGAPIDRTEISALQRDPIALMDYLRASVYALSPQPFSDLGYGWNGE